MRERGNKGGGGWGGAKQMARVEAECENCKHLKRGTSGEQEAINLSSNCDSHCPKLNKSLKSRM